MSFIKVRPMQSVNSNSIIQALLLPIATPAVIGYSLDNENVWRNENGKQFDPQNYNGAVYLVPCREEGGYEYNYYLPDVTGRDIHIGKWFSSDEYSKGDYRLLVIRTSFDVIVEVVDMSLVWRNTNDNFGFEYQRLKQLNLID